MSGYIKLFLPVIALLLMQSAFAQNKKKDLESKKKQLQKEIQYTEGLLNETKKNKKLSLNQLLTLNKKISIREELIQAISAGIRLLNKQIEESKGIIQSMENDLKILKDEYAKMVYYAYKNRNSYDKLMFIFSSGDFNQAYNRLKYLQQYAEYRKKQAELIKKTQVLLDKKIQDMEAKKQAKEALLNTEELEKQHLAREKTEKEGFLGKLQEKEKDLIQALKEKEKEQKQLQLAIQRIIEEEMRKAKEVAKKAGKAVPAGLASTPEALKLSATFESNRSKLPWPVAEGVITGKFGEHDHPVLKGIKINNNGVDISTQKGSSVRAVFEGEVTGLAVVPGFGKVVMVRHGEYLSVYSNLGEVFVNKGDKLTTKQYIGVVDANEGSTKCEVHLEIWKGSIVLNPELWLFKTN